ncbi:MAG TPA: LysR substrate-binding domain-containing protein [Rhodanobacteraceae bacterium]|nr:LysR substrate-binding domain-containing protein [Rhodanobacteraceae bacterium]
MDSARQYGERPAGTPDGAALTHLPLPTLKADLDSGRLETALDRWLPPYDGLHFYYPSRYQVPPKLRVFIDFLKQRMG